MQSTIDRLRACRTKSKDREGGFTLIELLIVIVILAILAAIVVFAVQNLTGSSAKSACNSDQKTVENALEAFKAQTGAYPNGADALAAGTPTGAPVEPAGDVVNALMAAKGGNGPWLKDFPVNGSHYQISADSTGAIKVYHTDGTPAAGGNPQVDPTAVANNCAGVS
jgi:general secretion pathway protein G